MMSVDTLVDTCNSNGNSNSFGIVGDRQYTESSG